MESARYMANVVTSANLLFGAMSVFLSVIGRYIPAAWILVFSFVFDIIDGKLARMSGEISQFGKQFDSLADLISFILAPAVLIFTLDCPDFFLWRLLVCLVVVFCGAFRLARFNSEAEEEHFLFFNGLPSPAFAITIVSIVLVYYRYNLHIEPRIISVVTAIFAMMMVSHIKYPTFKNLSLFHWKYLLGFVIILGILLRFPELTVMGLALTYLLCMPFLKRKIETEAKQ